MPGNARAASPPDADDAVLRWLREDLLAEDAPAPADLAALLAGDVTTAALARGARLRAHVVAREPGVAAGLAEASAVFARLGAKVEHRAADGDAFPAGGVLLVVDGPAPAVLAGERLALNLVGRLSGVATLTRAVVERVRAANPRCRVAATRKTTPGLRALEKRAVVLGGGEPHRQGLHDAFLVKDNHLAFLPDAAEAVRRCRAARPDLPVEVEADDEAQAVAAAKAGADAVLLDNLAPDAAARAARAVRAANPRCLVEVSGGLTIDNVALYAPHADRVSLGRLTQAARAIDVGLDVVGP